MTYEIPEKAELLRLVEVLRAIAESPDYWRMSSDLHEAADILELLAAEEEGA